MNEKDKKEISNKDWSIQDYLSLGYLYLLFLGIVRDVIFYNFFNINILNYSDIMDTLLSPLRFLADKPKVLVVLVIIIVIAKLYLNFMPKIITKIESKIKKKSKKEIKETFLSKKDGLIFLLAMFIASFFMGTGIGSGIKTKKIIDTKNFKVNTKITNINNEVLEVKMIGQNSNFIFYAEKNSSKIIVSPIQNNIIKIEKIND